MLGIQSVLDVTQGICQGMYKYTVQFEGQLVWNSRRCGNLICAVLPRLAFLIVFYSFQRQCKRRSWSKNGCIMQFKIIIRNSVIKVISRDE